MTGCYFCLLNHFDIVYRSNCTWKLQKIYMSQCFGELSNIIIKLNNLGFFLHFLWLVFIKEPTKKAKTILKSVHFKKTVAKSSFLSKVWSFSLTLYDFSENDITFERNEVCATVFLQSTDFDKKKHLPAWRNFKIFFSRPLFTNLLGRKLYFWIQVPFWG